MKAGLVCAALVLTSACEPERRVVDVRMQAGSECDFTPLLAPDGRGPALLGAVPGTMTPMPLDAARVIDPAIANKILVQMVARRTMPTGAAGAYARLVNCTDFPQQLQARTHFLDAARMPAEQPSGWRRLYLQPRALTDYEEASTGRGNAAYFLIEIREAR